MVRDQAVRSGPIRFAGGPLHNQIRHVNQWDRLMIPEGFRCTYQLTKLSATIQKPARTDPWAAEMGDGFVWFEYWLAGTDQWSGGMGQPAFGPGKLNGLAMEWRIKEMGFTTPKPKL